MCKQQTETLVAVETISGHCQRIVTNQRTITVTSHDGPVYRDEDDVCLGMSISRIFVRTFTYPGYGMIDYPVDQVPSGVMVSQLVVVFANGCTLTVHAEGRDYGFSRDCMVEMDGKVAACKVPMV